MKRWLYVGAILACGMTAWAQSRPAGSSAMTSAPATATAPGGAGVASGGLPTVADLTKQMDDGQFREALKSLQRVLDLKGAAAAPYNRGEMLMLRAECQLQIREAQAALTTLEAVAKEARGTKDQEPNPVMLGKALALSSLISKSPNQQYTPKIRTGPLAPKPINILDRETRHDAYKALFDDMLPDAKNKVRVMQTTTTLQPLLDTAKTIAALRAIETVANGVEDESKALAGQLTTRATILLGNSIADLNAAIDTIASAANQVYVTSSVRIEAGTGNRVIDQVPHRRGLGNDQAARLRTIQQNCTQTISACSDLALALDATEKFRGVANDADNVSKRAGKVLTDDYTRMP